MAREQITVNLKPSILAGVERYRVAQAIVPSRSVAVEALLRDALHRAFPQLDLGLDEDVPAPPPRKQSPRKK